MTRSRRRTRPIRPSRVSTYQIDRGPTLMPSQGRALGWAGYGLSWLQGITTSDPWPWMAGIGCLLFLALTDRWEQK